MAHWPMIKLSYDADGYAKYRGLNAKLDANLSSPDWKIFRFIYDANGNFDTLKGPYTGAWNDRENIC